MDTPDHKTSSRHTEDSGLKQGPLESPADKAVGEGKSERPHGGEWGAYLELH